MNCESAMLTSWQATLQTAHTRRVYSAALDSLCAHSGATPETITPEAVPGWLAALHRAGRSAATLRLYLAAVRSFFAFRAAQAGTPAPEIPAPDFNYRPTPPPPHVGPDQIRALLRAIPNHTPDGLRDYACTLGLVVTGQTASDWLRLRWREVCTPDFPAAVREAIHAYLETAGRLDTIRDHDFVFVAHSDRAARLPNVDGDWQAGVQPLSGAAVNQALKRHARRAGLDPMAVNTRTLRRSALLLHHQVGGNPAALAQLFGYQSHASARRYLREVARGPEVAWQRVGALLGV